MKTICAEGLDPVYACSLIGGSLSGSPQVSRLFDSVHFPVKSLSYFGSLNFSTNSFTRCGPDARNWGHLARPFGVHLCLPHDVLQIPEKWVTVGKCREDAEWSQYQEESVCLERWEAVWGGLSRTLHPYLFHLGEMSIFPFWWKSTPLRNQDNHLPAKQRRHREIFKETNSQSTWWS